MQARPHRRRPARTTAGGERTPRLRTALAQRRDMRTVRRVRRQTSRCPPRHIASAGRDVPARGSPPPPAGQQMPGGAGRHRQRATRPPSELRRMRQRSSGSRRPPSRCQHCPSASAASRSGSPSLLTAPAVVPRRRPCRHTRRWAVRVSTGPLARAGRVTSGETSGARVYGAAEDPLPVPPWRRVPSASWRPMARTRGPAVSRFRCSAGASPRGGQRGNRMRDTSGTQGGRDRVAPSQSRETNDSEESAGPTS